MYEVEDGEDTTGVEAGTIVVLLWPEIVNEATILSF